MTRTNSLQDDLSIASSEQAASNENASTISRVGRAWRFQTTLWLRVGGAAIGLLALGVYMLSGASWWLFAGFFLVPDLFMIGYLRGGQSAAVIYNLGYTYAVPAALAATGLGTETPVIVAIATIWTAHIGFDRMLGYGLKHSEGFKHTHLGRL